MQVTQAVRQEQARQLHAQLMLAIGASQAAALLFAIMLRNTLPSLPLTLWLGAQWLLAAGGVWMCRTFRGSRLSADNTAGWFRATRIEAISAGLIWGGGVAYIVMLGPEALRTVALACLMMLAVGSLFCHNIHYPTYLCFVSPMTGLTVIGLFSTGDRAAEALGTAALIFSLVLALAGWRFNRSFTESLRLRFENLQLVQELTEQKEAAEAANLAKSRFLAAASHDLRQPMHALNLYHGTLEAMAPPGHAGALIANAQQCARAMDGLFDALLDMSRLDAGAVQPRLASFGVQELLQRLEIEFAPIARGKDLRFRIHSSKGLAYGDVTLVEQMLRNLVSNALRYTEKGGVLVACRKVAGGLRVAVYDTGIGIAPELHQKVFDEYFQVGNAERDRRQGLGLGLSIVGRLSRLLGTPIALRSTPGRGSTFSFDLPLLSAETRVVLPEPDIQLHATLAGKLILVIDDEELVLDSMRTLLRQWGCEVLTAESAAQAMAQLALGSRRPDCIVCDYRLRGSEDGQAAVAKLREEFCLEIPAMLITGDTGIERLQALRASGLMVLHKPLQARELREALDQLLPAGPSIMAWQGEPLHSARDPER